MGYFDTLNSEQKKNAEKVTQRLTENGITNPFDIASILAVVSKESKFIPQNEIGYGNTTASRIKQIFGSSRFAGMSDSQIEQLAKDNVAFFERIYGVNSGATLGNKEYGDGWKFRGRGFNQLTGRYAYEKIGNQIGIDLVKNPDKVNDVEVATDVMVQFFKNRFSDPNNRLPEYNSTGMNKFKSIEDSLGAYYHANAGWGKTKNQILADPTGGRAKAVDRVDDLFDFVKNFSPKKKSGLVLAMTITALLILSSYVLYKTLKNK